MPWHHSLAGNTLLACFLLLLICLSSSHPKSLLCKFLLCVKVQLYTHVMYFVVMEHVFPHGVTIHERYDLKVCACMRVPLATAPRR